MFTSTAPRGRKHIRRSGPRVIKRKGGLHTCTYVYAGERRKNEEVNSLSLARAHEREWIRHAAIKFAPIKTIYFEAGVVPRKLRVRGVGKKQFFFFCNLCERARVWGTRSSLEAETREVYACVYMTNESARVYFSPGFLCLLAFGLITISILIFLFIF